MPPPRAINYSIRLSDRIEMVCFRLDPSAGCGDTSHSVSAWTLSLTRMLTTEGHRHATASSHTPF